MFEPPEHSVVVPFKNARFRGTQSTEVRIRILSLWQVQEARSAAIKRVVAEIKDLSPNYELALWSEQGVKMIHEYTAVEMMSRACFSVDPMPGSDEDKPHYARLWLTPEAVAKSLTAEDEFQRLWQIVFSVQMPYLEAEEEDDDTE